MTREAVRVMWLLNHSSARKFEVPMLNRIGFKEIFLPKRYPDEIAFRSASIDYSQDANLSIPADALEILNAADWYGCPGKDAWAVANRYFDVLFFNLPSSSFVADVSANFKGAVIWRAYGLDGSLSYEKLRAICSRGLSTIERLGPRFWFGQAYSHLHHIESGFIRERAVFLPLGMYDDACGVDQWKGGDRRVFFVCPDAGFNPYYRDIYDRFKLEFGDFPHVIGGVQPIPLNDPAVLGFVSSDEHARNMRELRLMFYHSREPNHIHYHPFEAVRAGMPLLFMAGGVLDRMGGVGLQGRCETIEEARSKTRRILDDDRDLIADIRGSQSRLLDSMRPENCERAWHDGFERILGKLERSRAVRSVEPTGPRKRIAVIVPVEYSGGTLRGAKLLAQALWSGSRAWGEDADVVLAHLDNAERYPDEVFADLLPGVARRSYSWTVLDAPTARRTMRFAGHQWEPAATHYQVPDDGIRQFGDCDLWIVVSDRLSRPLLPLRPYVCMVYDYLQRYEESLSKMPDRPFLDAVRQARRVLVTTRFTEQDALQYAGLKPTDVVRVPMLAPMHERFSPRECSRDESSYFLWTTNAAPHKNHENAVLALKKYYEDLDGKLECRITGVNTDTLTEDGRAHLKRATTIVAGSSLLQQRVRWLGELPDDGYRALLESAAFLWHPARIDNGTFSVVEAAHVGVPSLSSDYPAMREIDSTFHLNLAWMDGGNPGLMAKRLKWMEENAGAARAVLPSREVLAEQAPERLGPDYWKVVRECL